MALGEGERFAGWFVWAPARRGGRLMRKVRVVCGHEPIFQRKFPIGAKLQRRLPLLPASLLQALPLVSS